MRLVDVFDPDGNRWLVQEIQMRLPGRAWLQFESTRADRAGFLGSKRGVTPNLDALAQKSLAIVERAEGPNHLHVAYALREQAMKRPGKAALEPLGYRLDWGPELDGIGDKRAQSLDFGRRTDLVRTRRCHALVGRFRMTTRAASRSPRRASPTDRPGSG